MINIDLTRPHGFLVWKGKQKAIANVDPFEINESFVITSDGEAYGIVTFAGAEKVNLKDFDARIDEHRFKVYERKVIWPDAETLYIQPFASIEKFDNPKQFIINAEGEVVFNEPLELSDNEQSFINKAQELPSKITLIKNVLRTDNNAHVVSAPFVEDSVIEIVKAAIEDANLSSDTAGSSVIDLYDLSLTRIPNMQIKQGWVPPNYGDALGEERQCANCNFFQVDEGLCELYNVYVFNEDVCNSWEEIDVTELEPVEEQQVPEHSIEEIIQMTILALGKQFDDSDWNGAASNWPTTKAYCSDCLIDVNSSGEDKVQSLCKLPYRKDGNDEPNKKALAAIAGGRGFSALVKPDDVSQSDWNKAVKAAAKKVIDWYPDAFDKLAPDSVYEAAGLQPPEQDEEKTFAQRTINKLRAASQVISNMLNWAENKNVNFKLEGESGFGIKDSADGPIFYTWSSNAFEDREREIISTRALEEYVKENDPNEFKGFFNYWHIPGTDFAAKKFQAVIGRILIEAGPFLNDANGKAAQKFFNTHPRNHPDYAQEGWGASIEYKYLPEELWEGVYDWVWITRTSVLPKAMAANINTVGGVTMAKKQMSQEQINLGRQMFGEEEFDQIINDAEDKTTLLERESNFKESDEEEVATEPVVEPETEEENDDKDAPEKVVDDVEGDVAPVTENEQTEEEDADNSDQVTESESEEEDAAEDTKDDEDAEVKTMELIVKEVTDQLTAGLKDELAVIATLPEVMQELSNRVTQLEKQAQIKQVSEQSRFSLFNQAAASVTTSEKTVVKEEDVKDVGPETNDGKKAPADHFFTR